MWTEWGKTGQKPRKLAERAHASYSAVASTTVFCYSGSVTNRNDMVRRYVRKTTRGCWDERAMVAAMDAIQSGKMGYLQSAKKHGVPKSTLRRIMKKLEVHGEVNIRCPLGSKASIFTADEEKELVEYLITMETRLFSLTNIVRRKLAYELATKNGKANKWKDNIAGREWFRDFMRRHDELMPKLHEKSSSPKVVGFNKPAVMKFYEALGDLYNKYQMTPDRIYNCDETSITCDQKTEGKVISLKGKAQAVQSATEIGQTITVEVCMSATGVFIPLLFIFPRSTLDPQFTSHLILPCYTRCHDSGWMESDIFVWWLDHFIKFSRATKEHPVLLLMDGDTSHAMTIELLHLARENGVIMLCLPNHCTHKIQPLEVEFFPPLSKHYSAAVRNWLATNPGQSVTIYQIPMLYEQAFIQTATMATALVAFRKTGIWPFNPNNFSDQDFSGATTNYLPQQGAAPVVPQQCLVNNFKEPAVPTWKPPMNSGNEMRTAASSAFVEAVLGEPQNYPPRKRPVPSAIPLGGPNYMTHNMEPVAPGPSWRPNMNSVNEMRLSTSSAYVEAVLGGPQNHPTRNMEEPQVPGPSSEPAIYNMIPHMFL